MSLKYVIQCAYIKDCFINNFLTIHNLEGTWMKTNDSRFKGREQRKMQKKDMHTWV